MSEFLESLIPAVEEQMGSAVTPFVKETFDRLISDPEILEADAKMMIALCLGDETERMLDEERGFDLKRYHTLLTLLPTLPE